MEKRITIFLVMAMLLCSVPTLSTFAQIENSISTPPCIPPEQAPKPLTKEEYQKMALRNICLDPDRFYYDSTGYTKDDWRRINRAITARYAELYLSHPEVFKWAGMAAYASNLVGWGMSRSASLIPPWNSDLFYALQSGNINVYLDLAWQHEAYQREGICALERIYGEGKLEKAQLDGWRKIDQGMKNGNSDLVWQGNADLLKFEQNVALQTWVYDKNRALFQHVSDSWLMPTFSPIPGDSVTFVNYIKTAHPDTKPDMGDVNQRWNWINNSMLPKYMQLEKGSSYVALHMTKFLNEQGCKPPALNRSPIPQRCPCEVWNIAPETQPTPTTEPSVPTTPTTPQPTPTPTTPTTPPTEPTPQPPPEPPGPTCPDGQVLEDGECVIECPEGQVLEDGECIDPTDITCPDGQVLEDGECVEPSEPPEDGGSDGGGGTDEPGEPSDGGGEDNGDGEGNGDVNTED